MPVAQRVHVVLEDDIDGSEAAETISFALHGTAYEIDLSESNAAQLRDALATYVGAARKTSRAAGRSKKNAGQAGASAAEIRDWAKSNGFEVPDRGRIPANVREAFNAR